MTGLVKVLLVILFAVVIALFAIQDTGYVLISRAPWVVELSLTFAALTIGIGFIIFYIVLRFISNSWGVGERVREWRMQRRNKLARKNLNQTLIELAQRTSKMADK